MEVSKPSHQLLQLVVSSILSVGVHMKNINLGNNDPRSVFISGILRRIASVLNRYGIALMYRSYEGNCWKHGKTYFQ
jgi:hypothetical protein